ncbi:MAG TPA: UDP-3-O-(3-hydroxymyristoyl)glucosamine N-acyltransferase [Candidatus Polarisedimenticolaceae bacterium]|nr:UDP-3-O-(3-hydroxymyristoyl)glucosamine N-acyltransferase [Candidatus Polarisedimenticolaceae bacterium]
MRLGELAARVGGHVRGDPDREIDGVATLDAAGPAHLAFLTNARYRGSAARSRAGAILVGPGTELPGRDLLEAPQPYVALALALEQFHPEVRPAAGISPDARLGEGVRLGKGVSVAAFAVLGARVTLGDGVVVGAGTVLGDEVEVGPETVLAPKVVLYPRTRVGARCRIHAGAVLGADGFGFATTAEGHRKIPQVARVVVEDDVEIGANTTIDRGALEDTVIGRGTKLDDLVMVAHGVRLGPHGLMAAQSGIAGSTRVGAWATFAGQAGAAGHLTLGDRVVVAAKSAVFADVGEKAFVAGIPADDHRRWKREQAALKRLPELLQRVRALEAKLGERAKGEET